MGQPSKLSPWAKYEVDHEFFFELSLESAYWAGFIAADGSISSSKPVVCLTLGGIYACNTMGVEFWSGYSCR
jgi:hypothetical protein